MEAKEQDNGRRRKELSNKISKSKRKISFLFKEIDFGVLFFFSFVFLVLEKLKGEGKIKGLRIGRERGGGKKKVRKERKNAKYEDEERDERERRRGRERSGNEKKEKKRKGR